MSFMDTLRSFTGANLADGGAEKEAARAEPGDAHGDAESPGETRSNQAQAAPSTTSGYDSDESDEYMSVKSFGSRRASAGAETPAATKVVCEERRSSILLQRRKVRLVKPKVFCLTVRSKGIATLLLILVFVAALFAFAALFQVAESEAEIQRNQEYVAIMSKVRTEVSPELYERLAEYVGVDDTRGTENFVSYNAESGTWESFSAQAFMSSYYYSFVVATTIGYGEIVTATAAGKWLTIALVLSMLPVAIVTYTRLADFLSNLAMKLILKQSHEFRAVLRKYDADGSGSLDRAELKAGFSDLGLDLNDDDVQYLLDEFDDDKNGSLDVDEFAYAATELDVKVGKMARQSLKLHFAVGSLVLFFGVFCVIAAFTLSVGALDAVYFSVVTLTTVGLGDITPPPAARAALTIPIFIALGLVALVIGSITENLQPKERTVNELDFGSQPSESDNSMGRGPVQRRGTAEAGQLRDPFEVPIVMA